MVMNPVKGNMYNFVNFTWNPIKGKCPIECFYCYYQSNPRYKEKIGELRLDDKCFKNNLGKGNFIFVGSSTDMWADEVPDEWLLSVLGYIRKYPKNTYLFQSKNPKRFLDFYDRDEKNIIFGTTIETNMTNPNTKAPSPRDRAKAMSMLEGCRTMVSIEPIENFNLDELLFLIKGIEPEFVSVGADSKNSNLIEPSESNIKNLIKELRTFTEVKIKGNLARLCPKGCV